MVTSHERSVGACRTVLGMAAACLLLVAFVSHALGAQSATLISSDFTTNTLSGATANSIEWSVSPNVTMLNSGGLTSLNGYNFAVRGGQSTNNNLLVYNNLNTADQTANLRGFSASFSVSAGFILSRLTVKATHVNDAGAKQSGVSTLNYRIIRISDSLTVASGSQSFDYAGATIFFDRVFTLSGDLEAGVSYRLEVGINNLVSGSAFAIYDGVTLEAYPAPGTSPNVAQRVNFSKYQNVTASVVGSTYTADFAVDGIVSNFNSWRTGNVSGPHSLEITYPRPVTLGSVHLYSGLLTASTSQLWQNFRIQYHNGSTWVDITGSAVSGNTSPERIVNFTSPVTSVRFRLLGSDSGSRAVREIAMFPPNPNVNGVEQGYPIGTDVVLNLAYKRPVVASSIRGTDYAMKAADGFVHDSSRWLCNEVVSGQTLEVDLLSDHAIGSAHLHSGYYAALASPLSSFTLEFWDAVGGVWQPIPGATITGNTDMARVISFSSTVTARRVRLVANESTYGRVAELQLFPPKSEGYPIGQNIRHEAPPSAAWEDFSDASHRIRVQPGPDLRIGLIDGTAVFSGNSAGSPALDWQLLLNYRDGSYRIRNVATGLCLGLANISTGANIPVIGETYTGMPHQNWFLEYVSGTQFRILNAYSGLAIQSLGGSSSEGTQLIVTTPGVSILQRWQTEMQTHHPKKGIAATTGMIRTSNNPYVTDSDLTFHKDFTDRFGGSWSYGWGRQSSATLPYLAFDHAYNPMQWGNFSWDHGSPQGPPENLHRELHANPKPVYWLGFNEPESTSQGYIIPTDAVSYWPRLEAREAPLVAPVPASIPLNRNVEPATPAAGWLTDFTTQADALGYRRDYTAVHWYGGPNSSSLINHLEAVFEAFGRPVWLTEFSTVDWSGTSSWSDADNYNFLAEFLWRAESLNWLKRYSLFVFVEAASPDAPNQTGNDRPEAPRSNAIRADGTLTAFGALYAGWDGVASVVNQKSYHLHNKKEYRRVQNPGQTSVPADGVASVSPEASVAGTQWFLIPGTTANTVRVVSALDGRRLRYYTGTYVGMVAASLLTGQSEWRIVPDEYGWVFLEHPQSNTRLRISSTGTLLHGPITGNTDEYKWRFVVPAVSDPLIPDAPAVSALGGAKQISLAWTAVPGATSYSVERFDAAGQVWLNMATGLTQTLWTNIGLPGFTSYSYRVTATNLLGSSLPSPTATATTLHPLASLAAWKAEYLSTQQANRDDPDGDGVVNLLEYAHASSPNQASISPFKVLPLTSQSVTLQFPWNWRASDVTWQIRRGTDLGNIAAWTVAVPDNVSSVRNGDVDLLQLTFSISGTQNQFFILDVVASP